MRKRQPPRPGPERPKLPIDPEIVRVLASRLYNVRDIARILNCSPSTIRGRFQEAYEQGYCKCNAQLRILVFEAAMAGDLRALRYLLPASPICRLIAARACPGSENLSLNILSASVRMGASLF